MCHFFHQWRGHIADIILILSPTCITIALYARRTDYRPMCEESVKFAFVFTRIISIDEICITKTLIFYTFVRNIVILAILGFILPAILGVSCYEHIVTIQRRGSKACLLVPPCQTNKSLALLPGKRTVKNDCPQITNRDKRTQKRQ